MPKVFAIIALTALPTFVFAGESSCSDSEYEAQLEALDCPLILEAFAEFVPDVESQIERFTQSESPDREALLGVLEAFSAEETKLRDCLVKHGEPDAEQPIKEIYASASVALLALQSWMEDRPGREHKKEWAMSAFEELVQTMRTYEHNNALNTDAASRCAG